MTLAETRCTRCHRVLKDPGSISLGIGPECRNGAHVGRRRRSICLANHAGVERVRVDDTKGMRMQFHKVANIYPLLQGVEFESLCHSIKANGLRHPIITLDGQILDGRNRYRACEAVGVEPTFEAYTGSTELLDLLAFVRDMNEERRHLTSGQKAAVAVQSEELLKGLAEEAKERMKRKPAGFANERIHEQTSEKVAAAFGTNMHYIHDAQALKENAPRLFEQVLSGKVSLPSAVRQQKRENSSVTYKNQPAIHATRGAVPLAGNSHVYTVNKLLWPEDVEGLLESLLIGRSLHMCCGKSKLGTVRLDLHEPGVDLQVDAAHTGLDDKSFDTVLCDPPYNGEFQWNHDLLDEMARLASKRIIFQHWFLPADPDGLYKKANNFRLTDIYVWQPRTYFGRAQLISVFDTGV
jgi:uncharacterized protein DUF6011/ParB-like nuclease family protein